MPMANIDQHMLAEIKAGLIHLGLETCRPIKMYQKSELEMAVHFQTRLM